MDVEDGLVGADADGIVTVTVDGAATVVAVEVADVWEDAGARRGGHPARRHPGDAAKPRDQY